MNINLNCLKTKTVSTDPDDSAGNTYGITKKKTKNKFTIPS